MCAFTKLVIRFGGAASAAANPISSFVPFKSGQLSLIAATGNSSSRRLRSCTGAVRKIGILEYSSFSPSGDGLRISVLPGEKQRIFWSFLFGHREVTHLGSSLAHQHRIYVPVPLEPFELMSAKRIQRSTPSAQCTPRVRPFWVVQRRSPTDRPPGHLCFGSRSKCAACLSLYETGSTRQRPLVDL
jgi:hypothetical protein